MTMLAVSRNDSVFRFKCLHRAHSDRFLADVEMNEAADLARGVKLHAFLFEAANPQHLFKQEKRVLAIQSRLFSSIFLRHQSFSNVDRSPSGNPSSLAFSSRRMILPLRVFGTLSRKSISRGATAGPSRERAWPSSSLRKASLG